MLESFNNFKENIKEKKEYEEARELILFLSEKRIKLLGNDFRKKVGLEPKVLEKDEIINAVNRLNEIAEENKIKFNIPNNWEYIEKFLRLTILEDIGKEFKRQEK